MVHESGHVRRLATVKMPSNHRASLRDGAVERYAYATSKRQRSKGASTSSAAAVHANDDDMDDFE